MSRNEQMPFPVGQTYYNGDTVPSTQGDRGIINLLGKEYVCEDIALATGIARTNRYRVLRLMENNSGVTVYAKNIAILSADGKEIVGVVATLAAAGKPIDEYLPSSGCPAGDRCYVVIEGPAICKNCDAAVATNAHTAGNWVVAATVNAATTSTTAGRIGAADFTGYTTPLADQLNNKIGKAMSTSAATNLTGNDILVDVVR